MIAGTLFRIIWPCILAGQIAVGTHDLGDAIYCCTDGCVFGVNRPLRHAIPKEWLVEA